MGRILSIVERTRKTCYCSRQGSLISQNPPALDVGSVKSFKAVADYVHHCFDTRDELMDYILDALSKKNYRVQ